MITKLQNPEMLPSNVSQPEVESFYAGKNEISIESIELTEPKKVTNNETRASLIGERKQQAELQAAELNRQLDQTGTGNNAILPYIEPDAGIVTNNNDPEG